MTRDRSIRTRRRRVLAMPALVVAAVTLAARPAQAAEEAPVAECVADLLKEA